MSKAKWKLARAFPVNEHTQATLAQEIGDYATLLKMEGLDVQVRPRKGQVEVRVRQV